MNGRDVDAMETVRTKAAQAEFIAHVLDDALRLPGTKTRIGLDPVLGVVPLFGDAVVTTLGVSILLIARQLGVPLLVLVHMASNVLLNGLIGAFPILGDMFSVWFRSNAKNAALLLRAVSKGQADTCPIAAGPLTILDVALVLLLTAPVIFLVAWVSYVLWDRGISLI
jgi:uncharacterized protein DUF4112